MIDSHCHLDSEQFNEDREAVIERALAAGVETMVAIGSGDGPPDLEAGIRLADRYPFVYATIGVHPHDAANATAGTASHDTGEPRPDRVKSSDTVTALRCVNCR